MFANIYGRIGEKVVWSIGAWRMTLTPLQLTQRYLEVSRTNHVRLTFGTQMHETCRLSFFEGHSEANVLEVCSQDQMIRGLNVYWIKFVVCFLS